MDDNKQFWQRVAKGYAFFMKSSQTLYESIAGYVIPYLNRDMRVLELACGTGQLSFRLSPRVKLWEATDFSEKMITEARKRGASSSRLYFSVQDATELPYAPKSFDAVMISNALHIMPQPERAMEEIVRVLKDGGTLFAPTFIHHESSGFRFRIRLMSLMGFKTYSKWSADTFVRFVKQYGFEIKEQIVINSKLMPLCCLIAEKKSSGEVEKQDYVY